MVQMEAFGKMVQGARPSPWFERWAGLIAAGGAVLDVAAGAGRHAAFLAARGHPVTAIDRDVTALHERFRPPLQVRIVQADLEDGSPWPLPDATFAAVVVSRYLYRPLFPVLLRAIGPGGVLLYETFMAGHERVGRPGNPEFLLRDGELLDIARAAGLSVIAYEAGPVGTPVTAVLQRIAARRP